ncbi:hypothetical protein BKA63DRAFT_443397 [Paraphoma chrysanthemicola]|nr:hypothetical protein BKA63DRAFT_443397 [Paraphoma chrysanthemicola]
MATNDPWSWTVNDLIAELCRSDVVYKATNCAAEDFPDFAALENELRDQEITGATFLSALDTSTIRSELKIQSLGQRLALIAVIEQLRSRSKGYKQHMTTTGIRSLSIGTTSVSSSTLHTTYTLDANGRKRQKLTHITTTPLLAEGQPPQPNYNMWANDLQSNVVDGSGEYDYLLHWQKADQQGDSEPNKPSDAGKAPSRVKLTSDEVVAIINEQIDHFTNTWSLEKEAQKGEEIDPLASWEKAEADGTRHGLIESHKTNSAYYQQRLSTLCDEIVKDPGSNADIVRRQCRNLEETIDKIELSDYLVGIYSLEPEEDDETSTASHPESVHRDAEQPSHEPQLLARPTQQLVEVIDLGTPPDSSEDEQDSVLVDNSPLPDLTIGHQHSPSPSSRLTPDSVIADPTSPPASAPPPQSTARTATSQSQSHSRSLIHLDSSPELASIATARRWRWADLIATSDRKRIITKALLDLSHSTLETIRTRLHTVGKADMIREIPACITMFAANETKIHGVLPRDMSKIVVFTKLFLCWWLCDNYFRVEPQEWRLSELQKCLQEGSPDPSTFCDYLAVLMRTTFSPEALRRPDRPSQHEVVVISDDEDDDSGGAGGSGTQRDKRAVGLSSTQREEAIVID